MKIHSIKIFVFLYFISCFQVLATEGTAKPDSSPYDFNWKSSKDMSGAWFLCGFTLFLEGDCPKVWLKCHTDPDLLSFGWDGVKMKCLNFFSFFSSKEDAQETIRVADEESGEGSLGLSDAHEQVFSQDNETINDLEITTAEDKAEYKKLVDPDFDLTERNAVSSSEGLFNAEYSNFYYNGDGEGNGGWGDAYYLYYEYSTDIYTDELPNQTYSRVWDENWVTPNYRSYVSVHLPRDDYIPYPEDATDREKDIIDDKNRVLSDKYRAEMYEINAEIRAYNDKLRDRETTRVKAIAEKARDISQDKLDDAYAAWRSKQVWSEFGYKEDKFLSLYNEQRVMIFFDAYIVADNQCNGCGYSGGQEALEYVPLLLSDWGED
jgi:hypothetical protein